MKENGVWTMGCQFCTELNDEDLDSLGVQRNQIEKNIVDNRSYVRYPGSCPGAVP